MTESPAPAPAPAAAAAAAAAAAEAPSKTGGGPLGWLRRNGAAVFGIVLLVVALYVVAQEFRSLSVADIGRALRETPSATLWKAALWTLLAYAVLTVYDRLGSIYAGRPVSYARTAVASFCAYTMAHNIGFAAVSGAAVRYRFYAAWGLTPTEIAKVIAFTSLTFGLGGFALVGLTLLTNPDVIPWVGEGRAIPAWAAQLVALAMWGVVAAYVAASRFKSHVTLFRHRIDLPGVRLALAQVLLASVDVAVAAMIFYTLLPDAPGLTFLVFLGIYVAGYTAGLAASVPGGLGVFDGFMLLSLSPWLPAPQVVVALLLFRLYYYIVPLFLAGALFAAFELGQRRTLMARLRVEMRVADALEVPAVAGLVGLAGAVLLFIGALPARGPYAPVTAALGEWGALVGQFAASVVGSLLLVAAWGLVRRLRVALWAALALLANAALILAARADPWILVAAVGAIAAFLVALRGAFYRRARLTAEPITPSRLAALCALAACGLTLATVAYHGRVSEAAWWEVVVYGSGAPAPLRFAVAVSVLLLLVAAFRLLRPARARPDPYDAAAAARLRLLGARAPEPTGDDRLGALFAEGGRAGFAFRREPTAWVGLGDPAGDPAARVAAVWRFRDLCEAEGVEPAFVGVGRGMQRAYEDAGLTAVTLADGRVVAARAEGDPERVLALADAAAEVDEARRR